MHAKLELHANAAASLVICLLQSVIWGPAADVEQTLTMFATWHVLFLDDSTINDQAACGVDLYHGAVFTRLPGNLRTLHRQCHPCLSWVTADKLTKVGSWCTGGKGWTEGHQVVRGRDWQACHKPGGIP